MITSPSVVHAARPRPSASPAALHRLLTADLADLAGLQVGVATSAFQTEGGLDGPGEPETNWRAWADAGRVERIGAACDLWRRFDQVAERGRAMGLDVFRMGVEWARLCPHGEGFDARAVEGYAARLARLRAAGLEPIVTLQHFTHPAWLGPDFWLDERAPAVFARYAAGAVRAIGRALERRGERPLARVLTLNEPNMLAPATYLVGAFPHGRGALAEGDPRGVLHAARMFDQLLAAHARAWRAVHAVYAERGWPRPDVSLNLSYTDVYGVCRFVFDLLRAPELGVRRRELAAHVARGREEFYAGLCGEERSPRVETARALQQLYERLVAPELFDATLRALDERPHDPVLDSLAVDVYDPWTRNQLRSAGPLLDALARGDGALGILAGGGLGALAFAEPWDWVYEPQMLVRALRSLHDPRAPLPIDVMENGMAERRPAGVSHGVRDDGVTRPEFLRGYTFAVAHARAVEQLPVRTYCYWTLVDNYELGRYAPRFGLYALPDAPSRRAAGPWSDADSAGRDAAGALGAFARAVALTREGHAGVARAADALTALYHAPDEGTVHAMEATA